MKHALASSLLVGICGCATSYQPSGFTGGFGEQQLNDVTYVVRFDSNAYTSKGTTSRFLMRRCAELTLEHRHRFFLLGAGQGESSTSSAGFLGVVSFPSKEATIRFTDEKSDAALDTVVIIRDSQRAAGGQLSREARATLERVLPPNSVFGRMKMVGQTLYWQDGKTVWGTVAEIDPEHRHPEDKKLILPIRVVEKNTGLSRWMTERDVEGKLR